MILSILLQEHQSFTKTNAEKFLTRKNMHRNAKRSPKTLVPRSPKSSKVDEIQNATTDDAHPEIRRLARSTIAA
jgi:hypothetical protein